MVGSRVKTLGVVLLVLLISIGVAIAATGSVGGPVVGAATTSSTPACTFDGSKIPLLTNQKAGETVVIQCTNMGSLHPYLVMEVSLLLAIDPAAAPLLQGQITSLAGLMSLLNSLPEVNAAALQSPVSDLSGNMTVDYTLPSSLALDPNATCPPSLAQINTGLIGCGLAMIDLSTFKPVGAGSGLISYAGDPLFPTAAPTLAISPNRAAVGARISVSDAARRQELLVSRDNRGVDRAARWRLGAAADNRGHRPPGYVDRNTFAEHGHGVTRRLQPTDVGAAQDQRQCDRLDQGTRKAHRDRDLHSVPRRIPVEHRWLGKALRNPLTRVLPSGFTPAGEGGCSSPPLRRRGRDLSFPEEDRQFPHHRVPPWAHAFRHRGHRRCQCIEALVDEREDCAPLGRLTERHRKTRVVDGSCTALGPDEAPTEDQLLVGDELEDLALEPSDLLTASRVPDAKEPADPAVDLHPADAEFAGRHPPCHEIGFEPRVEDAGGGAPSVRSRWTVAASVVVMVSGLLSVGRPRVNRPDIRITWTTRSSRRAA